MSSTEIKHLKLKEENYIDQRMYFVSFKTNRDSRVQLKKKKKLKLNCYCKTHDWTHIDRQMVMNMTKTLRSSVSY